MILKYYMLESRIEYPSKIERLFLEDANGKPLHFLSIKEAEMFLNNPLWIDKNVRINYSIIEFEATINEVL